MKKYVIYLFLFMFLPLAAMAQSSMTDQQVMQFIVKEHNSGKSQSAMVVSSAFQAPTIAVSVADVWVMRLTSRQNSAVVVWPISMS